MKRYLTRWQFGGFVFVSLFGALLHFLYEWSNESNVIAAFSAVNESTWEHMKLMFFPMFIFALIQSRFFKEYESFWCVKLKGIITGIVLIPVLFYTFNGVFGKSPDWVNIAIFFVSAALAFLTETRLLRKDSLQCQRPYLAFGIICIIGVLFVLFTFFTPQIALFQDPVTGTYGINSKGM